jgi:crossover junction endonuclease MUS81
MLLLKIDCREKALIALFNTYKIPITIQSLDIGDIQIVIRENNVDAIQMVFERKTINDLYSSIRDGRYHEQKSRLVSNLSRDRITYIIEGEITDSKYIDINAVFGSLVHTIYRDKLIIYRSTNIKDTYDFIENIWKRYEKNIDEWNNFLEGNSKNSCLEVDTKVYKHTKKSENLTNDIIFTNMLSCIPGCSTRIAKGIIEHYPNMKLLIDAISINDKCLVDLKIDNRKIGPVLTKRIVDCLLQSI